MQFAKKEMNKRNDKKQLLTLFQDQEYDEYWHSKWNQVRWLQECVRALFVRYVVYDIMQLTILRWIEVD